MNPVSFHTYRKSDRDRDGSLPIELGGTGGLTKEVACESLGLISRDQSGKPNGVLLLGPNGLVSKNSISPEVSDPSLPSVDGPENVITGKKAVFYITNYDTSTFYAVSSTGGTFSRNTDKITFTAGNVSMVGGITINGRTFPVNVVKPDIQKPSIISPIDGTATPNTSVTLIASPFDSVDGIATHSQSDWEVFADASLSTPMYLVYNSTINLTSWTSQMKELTTFYARTRQHASDGRVSDWSTPISFTTGNDGFVNTEIQRLYASTYYSDERFGNAVAMSDDGTYLLVGAPLDDGGSKTNSGGAYAFTKVNGIYITKQYIRSSVPVVSECFGTAAAMSPDGLLAVITAQGWDTSGVVSGSAYVFSRSGDTWTQGQRISPNELTATDAYGSMCAISRDKSTIAVSCAYQSTGKGAVYIYTLVGGVWTQQAKLTPSQTDTWQDMSWQGLSISSDGNTLVAGAHGSDNGATADTGGVYVFTRSGSTWTQQALLRPADLAANQQFGFQAFVSDDGNMVVASYYSGAPAPQLGNAGSVRVFTRSGTVWTEGQKITVSDLQSADFFGYRIDFKGTKLLISANSQSPYANTGSVYVYNLVNGNFVFSNKIAPSVTYSNTYFGWRITTAYDGKTALISYLNANQGDSAGSVSVNV